MIGEHGRALRRDNLINDLLFGLAHADCEVAGDASWAGCSPLIGSPCLMLFRRGGCATHWTAHAMALIFGLRRNASHQLRRSRHNGDEQEYGLNACQHGSCVDGSVELDAGRPIFIPGWRRFCSILALSIPARAMA